MAMTRCERLGLLAVAKFVIEKPFLQPLQRRIGLSMQSLDALFRWHGRPDLMLIVTATCEPTGFDDHGLCRSAGHFNRPLTCVPFETRCAPIMLSTTIGEDRRPSWSPAKADFTPGERGK
jgi:hypothetical protein